MDPASAIGVASAAISFLNFAWKLVTGTIEVYKSSDGASKANAELEVIVVDLEATTKDLKSRIAGLADNGLTMSERRIKELSILCENKATVLLQLLEDLKVKGNRSFGASLRSKLASMRNKDKVDELKNSLQQYRMQILLNLTTALQDGQSSISRELERLKYDGANLKIEMLSGLDARKDKVLREIEIMGQSCNKSSNEVMASLATIGRTLRELQSASLGISLQHRILRQLFFDDIFTRQTNIRSAEGGTCEWLLTSESLSDLRTEAGQNLRNWLTEGQEVFHISGNPGAGKSTLTKFIAEHKKTQEALLEWAGTRTLVVASHYFWSSGTPLQRTLPGLYRSLLFQILSQHSELIEEAFPQQCQIFRKGPGDQLVESVGFREERVEEAIGIFLNKQENSPFRYCFFIDGLDECEGDIIAHEELANKLKSWTQGGCVKICTSSRPWREFIDRLNCPENRIIHLHKINIPDIELYCRNTFQTDRVAKDSQEDYTDLICHICWNSQGVFIWVHLVVEELLRSMRLGDSHGDLMRKLMQMPTKLNSLYDKLRETTAQNEIDRESSNRILLLALHNPFQRELSLISFSWLHADNELRDPEFPRDTDLSPYSEEEIKNRERRVQLQINGLAKGFLEVKPSSPEHPANMTNFDKQTVGFVHRTARDYFLDSPKRLASLQESFPHFLQDDTYGRMRLAELKFGSVTSWKCFMNPASLGPWLYRSRYDDIDRQKILNNSRKLQIIIKQVREYPYHRQRPIIPQIFFSDIASSERYIKTHWVEGSFLHFAAYDGLSQIVLAELDSDLSLILFPSGKRRVFGRGFKKNNDIPLRILRRLDQYGRTRGDVLQFSLDFETKWLKAPIKEKCQDRIDDFEINDIILCFWDKLNEDLRAELRADISGSPAGKLICNQTLCDAIKMHHHFFIRSIKSSLGPVFLFHSEEIRVC